MAIWLSILVYDNPVTFLGNLGTAVVILGVLLYNKAREYEQGRKGVGRTYLLKNPPDSSANGGSPTAFQAAPPTFDATLKTPLHSRESGEFVWLRDCDCFSDLLFYLWIVGSIFCLLAHAYQCRRLLWRLLLAVILIITVNIIIVGVNFFIVLSQLTLNPSQCSN